MPAPWSERVLAQLKRVRPANILAHLVDGTKSQVALGKSRHIWQPAMRVLEEIAWEKLELLDQHGKLLAIVPCNESGSGLDELTPRSKVGSEVHELVKVMLAAQREVLTSFQDMLRPVLEINRQMVHDLHGQAAVARKQASTALDNATNLADRLDRANALKESGDKEGFMSEMVELAKALSTMMPFLEQLGFVRAAPAPMRGRPAPPRGAPNGANGSTPPTPPKSEAA